jgi:PIF1-like helicase/Helitron helicase-like domain at N-terminus/Herpesvirus tegument protein, N-terminal conserved region
LEKYHCYFKNKLIVSSQLFTDAGKKTKNESRKLWKSKLRQNAEYRNKENIIRAKREETGCVGRKMTRGKRKRKKENVGNTISEDETIHATQNPESEDEENVHTGKPGKSSYFGSKEAGDERKRNKKEVNAATPVDETLHISQEPEFQAPTGKSQKSRNVCSKKTGDMGKCKKKKGNVATSEDETSPAIQHSEFEEEENVPSGKKQKSRNVGSKKTGQGRKRKRKKKDVSGATSEDEHATENVGNEKPSTGNQRLSEWDAAVKEYETQIKLGPSEVCVCCGNLWFRRSVSQVTKKAFSAKGVQDDVIRKVFYLHSEQDVGTFCRTCRRDATSGKVPQLCLANGLHYPPIPDCLKELTRLEERLTAPRIPFMQIRSIGSERQCSLKGNIINVPVSVDTSVSVLPRTFDQTFTIQLMLKRKMSFDHGFACETVRPYVIYAAASYLVTQPLYISQGVTLSSNWLENRPDVQDFVVDDTSQCADTNDGKVPPEASPEVDKDDDNLEEPEVLPGEEETLVNDVHNLCLAPGEGQRPLPMFADTEAEELSFPAIYCGKQRNITVRLSYNQIAKSEIRRYDRRGCRVDKLLYSYKLQEIRKLDRALGICLRKRKGSKVTAGNLLSNNMISSLIQHDDGFKILNTIRSSPAYWQKEKKKVMGMIRQFGVPTLFFTLSAAETRWPELLVLLYKVVDGVDVTPEFAMNAEFMEKARLIRSDPVTCARYFDHRVRCVLKMWKSTSGPFEGYEISDFYYRVEFQHRGSPHIHGLIWLIYAPKYDRTNPDSIIQCQDFIDKIITCNSKEKGLEDLVALQTHHHTRTCRKTSGKMKLCRFGLPLPPMSRTQILTPLSDGEVSVEKEAALKKKYFEVNRTLMEIIKATEHKCDTLEMFLEEIGMTHEDYILTLRANLAQPRVFLKRTPKDGMINAFNAKTLALHRANMDIQFVLDAFACCSYIINYINKSSRGISRLLNAAVQEVRDGNLTIQKRLQKVANVFVNGSEISAQEAAYNLLGMSVSNTSRAEVYINTSPPDERVGMLKSERELQELDPESTDIFHEGFIKHYSNRPDVLDNFCLAYVIGNYEYSTACKNKEVVEEVNEDLSDADDVPEVISKVLKLKAVKGYLRKRRQCKIIRYRRYCVETDPDNYYREQLMLFHPWRDEDVDLFGINFEDKYNLHRATIIANRMMYNYFESDRVIDEAMEQADNIEQEAVLTQNEESTIDKEYQSYAMELPEIDIMVQLGRAAPSDVVQTFTVPHVLSKTDFDILVRSLNMKQRAFLMHNLHHFKTSLLPYYVFLSGGAGVGKSRLIEAINQTLVRNFNTQPGQDPLQIKVLLCAPTGKAGFNIGGMTLHSTFKLPISQAGDKMCPLDAGTLNTIRCKLCDLKLIIIDEVSMVGTRMLHQIDARLKQIFQTAKAFGGISILAVGDFRQLQPVGDGWVFKANTADALNTLAGPTLWEMFSFYQLTEIMRQKDDALFANMLNRLAVGEMTSEDLSLMQERMFNGKLQDIPREALHLFRTNAEVSAFNNQRLSTYNTETAVFDAFDRVIGDGPDDAREYTLAQAVGLELCKTFGLPLRLVLKVEARYLLSVNIDTSDGLVNGALGVLRRIDYGTNEKGDRIPLRAWLDFNDPHVGSAARAKFSALVKQCDINAEWTPIDPINRIIYRRQHSNLQVNRIQFPLNVAEGMTVHKIQGSTCSQVAVNVRGMPRALLYVACSRATSANGLYIVGAFNPPKPPKDTSAAVVEMKRLHTRTMIPIFDNLLTRDDSTYTALYHNVQSLHCHYEDIVPDMVYTSADLMLFVETWTLVTDNYSFSDYELIGHIYCTKRRTAYGCYCIIKRELHRLVSNVNRYAAADAHGHVEILTFNFDNITFCIVYSSPKVRTVTCEDLLRNALEHTLSSVIVVGDLNVDIKTVSNSRQQQLLASMNLISQLEPNAVTTNANTQIDWCFSNITVTATPYESYFSHHKPLHLRWNKTAMQDNPDSQSKPSCSQRQTSESQDNSVDKTMNAIVSALHRTHLGLTGDAVPKVLCGTFHQGETHFSRASRNNQCTAMAAVAVAFSFVKCPHSWNWGDLDDILFEGDRLYRSSAHNLSRGDIYLAVNQLDFVHSEINIQQWKISVRCTLNDTFVYGLLDPCRERAETLSTGLIHFFTNFNSGILMAHLTAVAIGKGENGTYWLFDSHSRNSKGCTEGNGTCCLIIFQNVQSLGDHFRRLLPRENAPFEICPLLFISSE